MPPLSLLDETGCVVIPLALGPLLLGLGVLVSVAVLFGLDHWLAQRRPRVRSRVEP